MDEVNYEVNKAYRTLRNHLYKVETMESLHVIWAYAMNIDHKRPFPHGVQSPDGFVEADYIQKIRWAAPWELESLAREVIINSHLNVQQEKTLRDANYFSGAMNKLKAVDGAISSEYINVNNVMREMARLAHRQLSVQEHCPNPADLSRYLKIFSYPDVNRLIEAETGLSAQKMFAIGLVIWSQSTERFGISSLKFDLPEIQQSDVVIFERLFSIEVENLKPILRSEVQINEKFNYAFNSLRRFPILRNPARSGSGILCPLPDLIFRQITSGIYYFVKWTGSAGNALGAAFQTYIGDVLIATRLEPRYDILVEDQLVKEHKQTVDWILTNTDEALFVECKTKRMTAKSKEELLSEENTDKDLDDLAEAVVQVYKTIKDYKEDKYPSLRLSEQRRIFPIVVTMEEWFLMGPTLDTVRDKVTAKVNTEGLPSEWLETMPFSICSTGEFETLAQVLKTETITNLIENKEKDRETRTWSLMAYLRNKHPEISHKRVDLFPNIYKEILPISLKDSDFLD